MRKQINWKKEIRDWSIILGFSSFGTLMALYSWLSSPTGQEVVRHLVRM